MQPAEDALRSELNRDLLANRCQFVIGPEYVGRFDNWVTFAIDESLKVTAHPHLAHCSANRDGRSLTLLGFIFDPTRPEADDLEIVRDLAARAQTADDIPELTAGLGGRWVLVFRDGQGAVLFHDALGLRQVVYTDGSNAEDLWCASQPGLLVDTLGLKVGEEARGFIDSYAFRQNDESWWPGESTPYTGIKRLLPNHSLCLTAGSTRRYWPGAEVPRLTLEEATDSIAPVLKGLMHCVAERFDSVAASLTAGWDSRLALAASRDVKDELTYMTVRQLKMPDDSPDLWVPARLASSLGFEHHIVRSSPLTDPGFLFQYKLNAPLAHDAWAPDAQSILEYYGLSNIGVTGSGGEIGRCFYRRPGLDRKTVTGKRLSSITRMGQHPFSVRHFESWIAGAECPDDIHILDLFYWEQRAGSWMAMAQLEYGMVWKEIFTPYNCRQVLSAMLGVEEKYRRPPDYKLFDELIRLLWPEVLGEPINPHTESAPSRRRGARKVVRNLVRRARKILSTKSF